MSVAELAARPSSLQEGSRTVGMYRLPVYLACTVLAVVSNYLLGKDMAWDTLNYHLYAGFSAFHDRFSQDYFAAGPQSYFNPYAYVPFYLLVKAGLSALQVSTILAIVHSSVLWLTFELAILVHPSEDRGRRVTVGVCAAALAFVNPILLQQIGSSFSDVTTAILVLGGWILLVGAVRTPGAARVLYGGLLLGIATALKLTNAVHAIAGFAVLILVSQDLRARIRANLAYAIALGTGFVIAMAPWSYRLERRFGNPLFPLMNSVFRSPEFTTEPLRHFRFIPASFAEGLWRPFAIINPIRMVHEELSAPDLRYAVLVLLAGVLFLRWLWRYLPHIGYTPMRSEAATAWRPLAALGCGLTVDWVFWLSNSGNGRYFLPMACVAAAVIAALLFRLCAARPKGALYVIVAVLAAQAVQLRMGTEFRWNPTPWNDGPQFDVGVPKRLATEPDLYLTMGTQSNSFLAVFLPEAAGMINFSGGYALGPEGASGARVAALIRQYAPHVRVLVRGARLYPDKESHDPRLSDVDKALERFSLRADTTDCATIAVQGLPRFMEITVVKDGNSAPTPKPPRDGTHLVSCRVVPEDIDRAALLARQHAADIVLDRLEDACPQLFQPRRVLTEHVGESWRRLYMNTDLMAWVSDGWVKFRDPVRSDELFFVGRESEWAKGQLKLACGRRDGHYFAHVLKSTEEP